jgi:excinuclease ABC subunit C
MKLFDGKFGSDRLRELPRQPGVYLFLDAKGRVLYAGKAKDLRRRLAGYRNASRRKAAHRKMRTLVRLAASLEIRPQESETQALLLENQLIRTLRPPYNVDVRGRVAEALQAARPSRLVGPGIARRELVQ